MKRIFLAVAMLAAAACSSTRGQSGPVNPPSAFSEEAMSGGRYRIVYTSPADATAKVVGERTLARAAQLTLDKGNEWFEIASKIDGKNMQLDKLPRKEMKGAKLNEVGFMDGATTPGTSRKDYVIETAGGHRLYLPRNSVNQGELELLKSLGVDVTGIKK